MSWEIIIPISGIRSEERVQASREWNIYSLVTLAFIPLFYSLRFFLAQDEHGVYLVKSRLTPG